MTSVYHYSLDKIGVLQQTFPEQKILRGNRYSTTVRMNDSSVKPAITSVNRTVPRLTLPRMIPKITCISWCSVDRPRLRIGISRVGRCPVDPRSHARPVVASDSSRRRDYRCRCKQRPEDRCFAAATRPPVRVRCSRDAPGRRPSRPSTLPLRTCRPPCDQVQQTFSNTIYRRCKRRF